MYNLIFPSPEARILDTFSADPYKKLSLEDIALRSDLKIPTVEKAIKKLHEFHFIGKNDKNNYFLDNNVLTNAYIIADIMCHRVNDDTLHDILESNDEDMKNIIYNAVKSKK